MYTICKFTIKTILVIRPRFLGKYVVRIIGVLLYMLFVFAFFSDLDILTSDCLFD